MRMVFIAGNWKMNKNKAEAKELAEGLKKNIGKVYENGCVLVCPPFTDLSVVSESVKDSGIKVGGQNMSWEEKGAFTGEVSPDMLKDSGCSFVILGHSERRKYFSETNENVNRKTKVALSQGLTPIVCVGESLEQREKGEAFSVIDNHIRGALNGISAEDVQKVIVAYEPVWAIGTGRTATPQQAEKVHSYIRELLKDLYSAEVAEKILILYGGSVKPGNIEELIAEQDIDGALVGGASLKVDSFTEIVKKSIENV